MWNKPTREELNRLPRLYETENISLEDKMIHMHCFLSGYDWCMAGYGLDERLKDVGSLWPSHPNLLEASFKFCNPPSILARKRRFCAHGFNVHFDFIPYNNHKCMYYSGLRIWSVAALCEKYNPKYNQIEIICLKTSIFFWGGRKRWKLRKERHVQTSFL